MKKSFVLFRAICLACLGASAANRLSSHIATMDGPDGYTFNKAISDKLAMEVYTPADAAGGICFGVQNAQKDITPSAIATVLANALMQGGTHSAMTADDGTPIHLVTAKDGATVVAIAGDKAASRFAVVIFRDAAAPLAASLLKTLKIK